MIKFTQNTYLSYTSSWLDYFYTQLETFALIKLVHTLPTLLEIKSGHLEFTPNGNVYGDRWGCNGYTEAASCCYGAGDDTPSYPQWVHSSALSLGTWSMLSTHEKSAKCHTVWAGRQTVQEPAGNPLFG